MPSHLHPLLAVLSGCVLAACASGPKPPAAKPAAPLPAYMQGVGTHPRFPAGLYIAGLGVSAESAGQADAAALATIASQIRAKVASEQKSFESESVGREGIESREDRSIAVTTTASFSRAALIKVIERRQLDGKFYAYAVLDKHEAGEVIGADYEAQARPFRAAVDEALAPGAPPRAFTAAYGRATRLAASLVTLGDELQAIDAARGGMVRADRDRLGKLRAARQEVIQRNAVRLTPAGATQDAVAVVARALASLGVPTTNAASGALELRLKVEETFPRGVGVCCQWDVRMELDGQPLMVEMHPMGCHSRDRSLARADVVRQLSAESLAEPLRGALAAVLPLAE